MPSRTRGFFLSFFRLWKHCICGNGLNNGNRKICFHLSPSYWGGMKKGYINSFLRLHCWTETKPEATHATIILNNCFKLALSDVYPTSSPCYDYECNLHKIYPSLYTVWLFSKASPTRWFSEQSSSIVSESFWYSNNNNCESFLPLDIEKTGRDVYICMCVLQLYRIYRIYVLH